MVQRRRQSRGTTAAERVLLEIAGCPAHQESALPPGRRDDGGFWYPVGYALPRDVCHAATREGRPRRGRPRRPQEGEPAPPPGSAGSTLPSGTDDTTSIVESEFVDSRERSD